MSETEKNVENLIISLSKSVKYCKKLLDETDLGLSHEIEGKHHLFKICSKIQNLILIDSELINPLINDNCISTTFNLTSAHDFKSLQDYSLNILKEVCQISNNDNLGDELINPSRPLDISLQNLYLQY